ncbi:unnamed protein product [Chondrus crispus]|uniref:DUF1995 domain-containing protein n=1 Tax=Chondrus crispus TaxID=2769 RepID=R7QC43_CHOCR|nr:unnamed protein product [Chondrus crispus]CDF35649.1 unnamed protein product [Chondrus crispus]|eukprot:XP_005715468.1 unnamed protein product [Chondrus crispus]
MIASSSRSRSLVPSAMAFAIPLPQGFHPLHRNQCRLFLCRQSPSIASIPSYRPRQSAVSAQENGSSQTSSEKTAPEGITASSENHMESSLAPAVSMPKLYDAWFEPDHELASQACCAVDRAYSSGVRKMELQWPTVPNLEEIEAGTKLNFEFGKQVSRNLGMATQSDYPLIKRYLAQFCNLYWAKRIASCESFRDRTVWALSCDDVSKNRAEGYLENVRPGSVRNPPKKGEIGKDDVVMILDPRDTSAWVKGAKLLPQGGEGVVVFLNSQFNETYGLTGPRNGVLKGTEPVYFLKRVTRGYVFRSFPEPWLAYLEKPDMSVEVVGEFEKLPKLSEIAKVVREVSNNRYGGFYNDRYVRGFGGRL